MRALAITARFSFRDDNLLSFARSLFFLPVFLCIRSGASSLDDFLRVQKAFKVFGRGDLA